MQPQKVHTRLATMRDPAGSMPASVGSVSAPVSYRMPRAQPLKTMGNVSQFGTLNFHQSMTAAATIARQTTRTGQLCQEKSFSMATILTPEKTEFGIHAASRGTEVPRLAEARGECRGGCFH